MASRVIRSSWSYSAAQEGPQAMPDGEVLTVPVPVPLFFGGQREGRGGRPVYEHQRAFGVAGGDIDLAFGGIDRDARGFGVGDADDLGTVVAWALNSSMTASSGRAVTDLIEDVEVPVGGRFGAVVDGEFAVDQVGEMALEGGGPVQFFDQITSWVEDLDRVVGGVGDVDDPAVEG